MDEVTGLNRFEAVPDTAWHDVRVAGPQWHLRLDAHRPLITVVKNQFHCSAHDVQELVTVRVDLTTMRSRPIDVGDRSDCVSIDSPWRSRRGRSDGHRPVASDVCDAPFEADRRRVPGSSHGHRLPVPVATAHAEVPFDAQVCSSRGDVRCAFWRASDRHFGSAPKETAFEPDVRDKLDDLARAVELMLRWRDCAASPLPRGTRGR